MTSVFTPLTRTGTLSRHGKLSENVKATLRSEAYRDDDFGQKPAFQ
jgi:hypothetical protein